MAAYVASQIGQNAQSVQTTVAAFALLEAQPIPPKSPPPEGARVRMKKGLHLAMKAFYFVRRCERGRLALTAMRTRLRAHRLSL